MSFNLDDPLAGILSDGSDDSFFDDDILGKKKPVKKKDAITAGKKKSLFDLGETDNPKTTSVSESKKEALFDLGGDTGKVLATLEPRASPAPLKRTTSKDSFNIPQVENKPKPFDISKSPAKPKVSVSADRIDILSEFGSEPKSLGKGKSSQSILDDILGGSSTKPGSSQATRPATAAKNKDFDFESFLGKTTDSKPPPKTAPQKPIGKIDIPREVAKKEEPKKKAGGDWLGIFQEDDTVTEENPEMPSWLVGGVQGSSEDITAEGAALYLQQQESQLMVAMQLKAQEERLVAMQTRQKESHRVHREAALAQHSQLDAMLQKQAEQRHQMQSIITAHQQRISQRIKALLGTAAENEDNTIPNDDFDATSNIHERNENPHKKEKTQLLQLVQSLQENHDKEIDLMETSYRKSCRKNRVIEKTGLALKDPWKRQLAFLEVTLNQAEERMKEESDKLVKFYSEKIHWLEEHHQLYKNMSEDNLSSLTERHRAENQMIRQQHLENIKILQEHHAVLMENIKNAVKQEQGLIQDSAGFSSDLHQLVTDVKENKLHCQKLVDNVETLVENTHRDSDRGLQQLKKERDNFETEKAESREIVKLLESRLKQMTTMIEEESAALKHKRMEFDFEKATFSKQTEFAKNILKKQDEEIKTLREDIQREYNENKSKIEEGRAKALKDSATTAKEKVSVQSLKQDLEKMKVELQAQLEEVTEQRSKLNVERQQMHMEEQRISAKSRDYDLLAKTTVDKQSQADKKYSEAEFLQRKYEERIRRIQEHVVSLNVREKQIAKEKVALSRERLLLHNERKQIESRQQCSLCKSTQNIPDYMQSYPLPEPVYTVPVSRDYRNVDSAMNNIERDIASLMSRNYSLRHSTDAGHSMTEAKFQSGEAGQFESETPFKELMDPKFMMLRLDVQKVLSNLDHSKTGEAVDNVGFEDKVEDLE
ncbi:Fas-binding factor 1 [Operophtera brumata]|uniref:Fas-binding factor 1 n=1 Tax=Operophtera brumata TaxID=104452 RepID=A0A0L7LJU5_OPEBR|nr:Fas-binding factor 1 [Operophtera brumata]